MVRWKTDFSKWVITSNFERRGWQEVHDEKDESWNIFWANVGTMRQVFASDSLQQLRPDQLINHFPNHYELTRKDLLVKNVKRYRRHARKLGVAVPELVPSTFVLPQEYALFVEEFRKQTSSTYILKPNGKAQGKGIFLVNKLSQVRERAAAAAAASAHGATGGGSVAQLFGQASSRPGTSSSSSSAATPMRPALDNYIVSRYIGNPLLLGGKKFDLRLYVLVPSYSPLVVYLATLGFARFCNVKYTRELAQLDNMFVHLTNVAVQKGGGDEYNAAHGNKWALADLRLHLEATRGHAATQQLFADMQQLVVHTLKAVQLVMINDKHCFELYGFDVIIDSDLQPWLIEVNASPSLTTTTKADRLLKFKIINDALSIVTPPSWSGSGAGSSGKGSSRNRKSAAADRQYPPALGCMQLIHDERSEADGSRRTTGEAVVTGDKGSAFGGGAATSRQLADASPRKVVVLHG
uniref:Tubulin--tyrosine ligase-like protein 9 n=1 Tax=Tetradesmus obliquus TaxID=3088 RepID=A0A383V6V1_TETOB|eukprot:jgi/Sobl393_1/11286/SZX60683.1